MTDQLVELGRARAQALGWPDAYAFTKSLGEVALADTKRRPARDRRAALDRRVLARRPRPGWIRGFRMAEPVIISYARGLLQAVPRRARGHHRRDPRRPGRGGDHRRRGPRAGISRGERVPGRVRRAEPAALRNRSSRSCEGWFTEHPLYDDHGQPIVVPEVVLPRPGQGPEPTCAGPSAGAARSRSASSSACPSGAISPSVPLASRSAATSPSAPSATSSSTGPTRRPRPVSASTARSSLFDSLDPVDQKTFCFDPAVLEWSTIRARRPPALDRRPRPGAHVARQAGRREARRPRHGAAILTAEPPLRGVRPRADPHQLERRRVLRLARDAPPRRRCAGRSCAAELLLEGPRLLAIDRRDRGDFLRSFYRRYEGAPGGTGARRRLGALQRPVADAGLPRRRSSACGRTAPSATRRSSSRGRSTS